MFRHFFRRFFLPIPPLRGLRLEHLQVLRCFFISRVPFFFFPLFFYYFVTIRSLENGTTKFPPPPPLPSFDLSYTRERIEGENSRKGDYTRYPFDDLGCSCFSRNLQRYSCLRDQRARSGM